MHGDDDIDPVHFNDGCVIQSGYIYVSGKLDRTGRDHADYSVLFWSQRMNDNSLEWYVDTDLAANVISVCTVAGPDGVMALGQQGEVHVNFFDEDEPRREQLPDAGIYGAGRLGAMSQIRAIGSSVYACGAHGQVYRRDPSGRWQHLDPALIDRSEDQPLTLNGIDGSAEDDIFAVGYGGRIVHWDGRRWEELDSPTNLHLERVCSVGRGEAYICGNEGTLLHVLGEGIMDLSADMPAHFWGLTVFEGRPYACTLTGIYALADDEELEELRLGLDRPVGCYRLDSKDGELWSVGPKDLLRFDGQAWTREVFPFNGE